ncbi:rapid alkalinization factor [Ziziphus jujuba]|uniref:Rapid alkalinization factor n=2 Tax=Ziziphus jujuba TaxID=326968 RepID=A0A6P4ACK6_ZIZJJ|nr:rapid alkalinization factor [Ziziphus jujuba]KAH7517089.1 hypothetical protein FEM48_Zijuj09G0025300 [Ziziphus jujuba var. spinosa]
MANSFSHFLVFYLFTIALIISYSTVTATINHRLSWVPMPTSRCQGSIAECMTENELDMDSESNRRILATSKYISYGALQRNTVPCSRKGASYYNCKPGAEANPYSRGCSAITRCRS